jgi:hypothetical protein
MKIEPEDAEALVGRFRKAYPSFNPSECVFTDVESSVDGKAEDITYVMVAEEIVDVTAAQKRKPGRPPLQKRQPGRFARETPKTTYDKFPLPPKGTHIMSSLGLHQKKARSRGTGPRELPDDHSKRYRFVAPTPPWNRASSNF